MGLLTEDAGRLPALVNELSAPRRCATLDAIDVLETERQGLTGHDGAEGHLTLRSHQLLMLDLIQPEAVADAFLQHPATLAVGHYEEPLEREQDPAVCRRRPDELLILT